MVKQLFLGLLFSFSCMVHCAKPARKPSPMAIWTQKQRAARAQQAEAERVQKEAAAKAVIAHKQQQLANIKADPAAYILHLINRVNELEAKLNAQSGGGTYVRPDKLD